MMTRNQLAALGAGGLLIAGAVTTIPSGGAGAQGGGTVDQDQAVQIALEAYPGATVLAIETEDEGGLTLHEVELSNGVEIEIDSASGEIVEEEQDNPATDDDDFPDTDD